MTSEEYEAWRDNGVTKWVLAAFRIAAEDAKTLWITRSWDAGVADEASLIELRARAQTYNDMALMSFEDLKATHGETDED